MKKVKSVLVFLFVSICMFSQNTQNAKTLNVDVDARNSAIEYLNQAGKLIMMNKKNESLPLIIASIKTDSTLMDSYDVLYKTGISLKNYSDSVLNCLNIGKRVYNDDDEIYFYAAEILRHRNEYNKAITEYSNAINIGKNKAEKSFLFLNYYTGRAVSYVKTSQYANAVNDYSQALLLDPENELVLINRGVCYQKLHDEKKAAADWEKAKSFGSNLANEYLEKLKK